MTDAGALSRGPATTALRLRGRDALPLLQRISTNALLDLPSGGARATLFCDFRGRLLHRAFIHLSRDRTVWLLRDDAPGAELAAFLDRHVFREDVTIEDQSARLPVSRNPTLAETREEDGEPRQVVHGEDRLEVGREVAADDRERILAGRPAHGHEIVDSYNPFEVGLGDEVHLDKGCYTGQEALQRLITYHSVRRKLARVEGRGRAPAVPAALEWNGERAGAVTSAVSHDGERWIGLAVIRSERLESGEIPTLGGEPLLAAPIALDAPRPLGRP
jgi:folate-binding protein YgfZ